MRLEILNRDHFTCVLCGDTDTELHVHHQEYRGNPWEANPDKLFTLCKYCHKEVEQYEPGAPVAEINISKLAGWGSGVRVMLSSFNEECLLRIYTADDELIVGLMLDAAAMSEIMRGLEYPMQRVANFYKSRGRTDISF